MFGIKIEDTFRNSHNFDQLPLTQREVQLRETPSGKLVAMIDGIVFELKQIETQAFATGMYEFQCFAPLGSSIESEVIVLPE